MCVYSMVMDSAINWPPNYWKSPSTEEVFKDLLKRAKEYDKKNNEPDCELESKKEILRKLAEEYNIKINFE